MEWIGCVRCEKSRCDFVARAYASIALVHPVLRRVSCSYEMIPNAPKHYVTHQNMSLGPMGWIGCVRREKSRHDFLARTFALIAPVHPVLNRVSCSYETIPNAPKHYAPHQNMSFGSNGWIGCVRREKSRCDLLARTFALIAPVHPTLHRVSCSYETIPNAPKHYATHQNMSLGSNGVDWMCSLRKILT